MDAESRRRFHHLQSLIASNPLNHGGRHDGEHDDTEAFLKAYEQSPSIYVPPGTFVIDNLSLDGAYVWGPGTLKWKSATTAAHMLAITGTCTFDGITFDGNASNQTSNTAVGIEMTAAPRTAFRNCRFTNFRYKVIRSDVANSPSCTFDCCWFYDTGVRSGCDVIMERSPRWRYTGCDFLNIGDGHCIRLGLLNGDDTSVPVDNVAINGCTFMTTQHVGITLEIYSRHVAVSGCTFDGLDSAIKCEVDGDTVWGLSVSGGSMKNLNITTALNLTVPYVKLTGVHLENVNGPLDIGDDASVTGCTLINVGDATRASIRQQGAFNGGTFANNVIRDAPGDAISVGDDTSIAGNRIYNTAGTAIPLSGERMSVKDNIINGCLDGITSSSTFANSGVGGNNVANATGDAYSFVVNANFATCVVSADNIGYAPVIPTYHIVSDAITLAPGDAFVRLDTELLAATDELKTITYSGTTPCLIVLRTSTVLRDVTVKHGTGNIRLDGGADCPLIGTRDSLMLRWNGSTEWCEVSRADNP
jgi:hypothetical protein